MNTLKTWPTCRWHDCVAITTSPISRSIYPSEQPWPETQAWDEKTGFYSTRIENIPDSSDLGKNGSIVVWRRTREIWLKWFHQNRPNQGEWKESALTNHHCLRESMEGWVAIIDSMTRRSKSLCLLRSDFLTIDRKSLCFGHSDRENPCRIFDSSRWGVRGVKTVFSWLKTSEDLIVYEQGLAMLRSRRIILNLT